MEMPSSYERFPALSEQDLVEAAYEITGGNVADLRPDQLARLLTIASFVFDCCLNEFERRGLLEEFEGRPLIPYISDHAVETVLTRT